MSETGDKMRAIFDEGFAAASVTKPHAAAEDGGYIGEMRVHMMIGLPNCPYPQQTFPAIAFMWGVRTWIMFNVEMIYDA
jgi:hypothetical protein